MQGRNNIIHNNIYKRENPFKVEQKNNQFQNETGQKNFVNGLRNARNILENLERSLQKTKKYEKKLIKCRASHLHSHSNEWWDNDSESEEKSRCSKSDAKPSRSQVDLAESWSTMSIVCLQYQYEELSKRYSSLLKAYNERCSSLNARESAVLRLRQRVRMTHAQLAHAHKAMLMIGEKYLALRERRLTQKSIYEEKISRLKRCVCDVLSAAEKARLELDKQLADSMNAEKDAASALLLHEIRKCNLLFLENLRLKAKLESITPGIVQWKS